MATEHDCELFGDAIEGDWKVACSCGWEEVRGFAQMVDATDAWENHCDAVFMEATERMVDRG